MPVANLRLRVVVIREREDENGEQQLEESTRGVDIALGRFGSLARRRGGLRLWHKIAIVLSPALFTLAKHALGLAGGLLTMAAVVSAAALPWVALAFTATRNISQMGEAGQRYVRGLAGVERAWMDLARRTAPETLGPVTDVLEGIAAAIPKLEPLVREIAPDMARMATDIRDWLSGRGFERFMQNIQDYGVPAFRNLTAAGKDFLATVGIGFRHFLPIARDIADTIRRGANDMRGTARAGGIARWLKDWRNNSEVASRFLREAADTTRIIVTLLNDLGPGQLSLINTGLGALNAVNPYTLMGIVLAWAAGKGILGLVAALRMMQALRALRALSFLPAAGQLTAATAALNAAAAVLTGMAAAINNLARMVATMGRRRVNTSKLDEIKKIWDSVPKNATATFNASSVNGVIVAMMAVNSTWVTIQTRLSAPANFSVRLDAGIFAVVVGSMAVAWGVVRASAMAVPVFTAVALAIGMAQMASITAAWARVRAMAGTAAFFFVTANPGNVPGVASQIIGAWARVRAAAAVRPRFTASGISGPVVAGAAAIVAAWMRVVRMPKMFRAVGTVSPGNVPGASSAIIASWRRLFGLARSWHGVATCNFSGGFGGISGGSVTTGGGGGWYDPTRLFVVHPPATFGPGRLPNLPDFPDPTLGGGNIGGIDTDKYFGNEGGKFSNPNPDDFAGGFATGGPVEGMRQAYGRVPRMTTGYGGGHTVHIYDDVWIRNTEDLVNILVEATK